MRVRLTEGEQSTLAECGMEALAADISSGAVSAREAEAAVRAVWSWAEDHSWDPPLPHPSPLASRLLPVAGELRRIAELIRPVLEALEAQAEAEAEASRASDLAVRVALGER